MNKKRRRLLVLIIILNIFLLITLIIYNKVTTPKQEDKNVEEVEEIVSDIYSPIGFMSLENLYSGEVTENYIEVRIKNIVKFITENSNKIKDLSNDEIKKYYDSISKEDLKRIGIDNYSDFENMIINIKKIGKNDLTYNYCRINAESMEEDEEKFDIDFYIILNEEDEIGFTMEIQNKYIPDGYTVKFIPQK